MTIHPRRAVRRPAALVESSVMGRAAVAVVVAVVLVPTAVGQLTGWVQGSETIDGLGVQHLATVWAVAMLVAAPAMVASYAARLPDDSRAFEITVNGLIAIGAAVHLAAILKEVGYSGAVWVCGMDAALIVNCGGRAILLGRQIFWVWQRKRAGE